MNQLARLHECRLPLHQEFHSAFENQRELFIGMPMRFGNRAPGERDPRDRHLLTADKAAKHITFHGRHRLFGHTVPVIDFHPASTIKYTFCTPTFARVMALSSSGMSFSAFAGYRPAIQRAGRQKNAAGQLKEADRRRLLGRYVTDLRRQDLRCRPTYASPGRRKWSGYSRFARGASGCALPGT